MLWFLGTSLGIARSGRSTKNETSGRFAGPKTGMGNRRRDHAARHGLRFCENEIAPNYEEYEKKEMVDRELWKRRVRTACFARPCPKNMAVPAEPMPMKRRSSRRLAMRASTGLASRCIRPSSHPTFCITAPRSRSRNGCRDLPAAN